MSRSADPVLVLGALGRMGQAVRSALGEEERLQLGAAIERPGHPELGQPIEQDVRTGDDLASGLRRSKLAIAFATPEASLELLRAAAEADTPCVIGTTGWSEGQRAEIHSLAGKIPIVLAANFSVAVNVLFHLARQAGELLGPTFDIEILELHHSAKVDAPSGTALALATAVAEGRGVTVADHLVLAREGHTGTRPGGAIGIQTLRGGDSAGEHTVLFVGRGERLELVHRSSTRDHFARGAVRAAVWVRGRPPGLYDMEQVLGLRAADSGQETAGGEP